MRQYPTRDTTGVEDSHLLPWSPQLHQAQVKTDKTT